MLVLVEEGSGAQMHVQKIFKMLFKVVKIMHLATPSCSYNLGQSLGTLYFYQHSNECPPLPPLPQHNVDVDSSEVDPLFQQCFSGGGGFGKLNKDVLLQNDASPVGILSSVPRTFGQDCSSQAYHLTERNKYTCINFT